MQPKGVNPFSNLAENLCEVQDLWVSHIPRPERPVRVALVSMPPFEPQQYEMKPFYIADPVPDGIRREDCERSLVALKGQVHKELLAAYKEALTFAVDEYRANIVCVSELGLPHHAIRPLAAAQEFAQNLSVSKNVLIVAGTSHDRRTYYNTGYIYHPEGSWSFHKSLSAAGMGELISAPAKRRVLSIKIFGLRIAVMVCLDIADYATLASVIRARERIDMVLVPCYTEKFDKMLDVAKVASRALRGIVAMVNAHIPNSKCHFARFGTDENPLDEQPFGSRAIVSLFEVDHEALQQERSRKHVRENSHIDWLFGNRDMPSIPPNPPMRQRASRA
jgi:predicted amidohydrolase